MATYAPFSTLGLNPSDHKAFTSPRPPKPHPYPITALDGRDEICKLVSGLPTPLSLSPSFSFLVVCFVKN